LQKGSESLSKRQEYPMTEELKLSPRISALKQVVEQCINQGMSKAKVLEICKSEVLGERLLRAAIQDCRAADKVVRMSFYEQVIDKQVKDGDILAAVNLAVGEKP
jgi:hypothetical protein